jgi:methyl-accepting chemotaxis protein
MKKTRRKKIVIMKSFQIKYAAIILMAMLVTAVTVGADFYYSLHGLLGASLSELPQLRDFMGSINQLLYAKIVALLVIAAAVSFLVSHKFAGPILKFEEGMNRLYEGNLNHKLYLRKGDELRHLGDYYNNIVDRYRKWAEDDRNVTEEISGRLDAIKDRMQDHGLRDEIEELRMKLNRIAENWKRGRS